MPGFDMVIRVGARMVRIGSNVNPFDGLAPSALTLTVLSASSIRLNWTVNSVNRDGTKIERSLDGISFTEVGNVSGATAVFIDTGLTDWTTYYYRVRTFKGATYSPYCYIQNAKTWGLDFIITIDTTKAGSASNVFVFPLTAKTVADVTIDWGDGNTDTYTTTGNKSHTYATPGVYQVKVGGGMTALAFNNTGDNLKLMYIDNWGSAKLSSCEYMFYGCSNMQGRYADSPNTAKVTSMAYMFSGCSAFNQSVSNFDTSNVTNMRSMFNGCSAFNQSVSNFDTAKVTSMAYMFSECSAFNQSVSNFDVSKVTIAGLMFLNCNINATGTTTNYDSTLIAWANNPTTPNNLAFHGGTSKYGAGAGAAARATLISKGWTITDGGLA